MHIPIWLIRETIGGHKTSVWYDTFQPEVLINAFPVYPKQTVAPAKFRLFVVLSSIFLTLYYSIVLALGQFTSSSVLKVSWWFLLVYYPHFRLVAWVMTLCHRYTIHRNNSKDFQFWKFRRLSILKIPKTFTLRNYNKILICKIQKICQILQFRKFEKLSI